MLVSPLVVIEALKGGVIGILLTVDTLIYGLISSAFKIFMAIAGARLLSSDVYYEIANKVYIVIGVLMLFVLAYSLLKGIVDPDQTLKNELGPKTVKNIIVAVVGLAITPVLFNLMYQAQGVMLENDILAKIFFRSDSSETYEVNGEELNPDEYVDTVGGSVTAVNIWQAFFYPAEDSGKEAKDITADVSDFYVNGVGHLAIAGLAAAGLAVGATLTTIPVVGWIIGGALIVGSIFAAGSDFSDGAEFSEVFPEGKITLEQAYQMAAGGEGFNVFTVFLPNYLDEGEITYYFLLSTIAGAFVLYAFVSFSIDMGIRAAKLAFLQIIAPVPLVMNVVPKSEKRLEKYVGIVVSTFMEVFVRIAVVYVVVFIICHLTELFSSVGGLWGNDELNTAEKMFALAFLILGLIAFCHSAPGFISQALGLDKGTMDGLGLKPSDFKKKLTDGGAVHAAAVGKSALKSGVNRWTGTKGKPIGERLRAGIGGFARGAAGGVAYAATNKMEWGAASKAADKVATDVVKTAELNAKGKADRPEARQAYEQAVEAVRNAKDNIAQLRQNGATDEQIAEAKAKLETARRKRDEARRRLEESLGSAGRALAEQERKISVWAAGTVDTTYIEERAKLYSDLRSLEGKLEDTVDKDDLVKAATARRKDLDNVDLKDMAYTEYLRSLAQNAKFNDANNLALRNNILGLQNAEKKEILRAMGVTQLGGRDISTMSDAQLGASFDAELTSGALKLDYRTIMSDAKLSEPVRQSLEVRVDEQEIQAQVHVAGTVSKNDYRVDVNSTDYRMAQAEYARAVKDADDALKDAKKDAVARKLAEAASGIDNETSRTLRDFFSEDQMKIIKNHLHGTMYTTVDPVTGQTKEVSISEYISENFGDKLFEGGLVDLSKIVSDQSASIKYTLSGGRPGVADETVEFVYDPASRQRVYRTSSGNVFDSVEKLQQWVEQQGYTKSKNSSTSITSNGITRTGVTTAVTSDMKDRAEVQKDKYESSQEVKSARARKKAAEKDKK